MWASVLLLLAAAVALADGAKPPHILFVAADDLGWNDVGFHGNSAIKTPNLDQLAHEGVILNHTYVQPVCSPTRSCFMSGRFPFHTGLQHYVIQPERGYGLNVSITTVAQRVKQLGYQTHIIGKWHLGFCNVKYTPTQRGFDTFFGYYCGAEDYFTHRRAGSAPNDDRGLSRHSVHFSGLDFHQDTPESYSNVLTDNGTYSAYAFSKQAVEIVNTYDESKGPLYLYMPFQSVHGPLQVPKRFEDMYNTTHNKQRRVFSGMVSAMDEAIGNVTAAFKQKGLWENTLMVFTTDNGGPVTVGANNWPLRGSKHTVWEGGTRGSAFIHGTMLEKTGYTYNGMMHSVDWYPTLMSIAGGEANDPMLDGIDMWAALKSNLTSPRSGFVYNIDKTGNVSAIRVGKWKYIDGEPGKPNQWYPPANASMSVHRYLTQHHANAGPDDGPWLFDIDNDPLEKNNLFTAMPEQVAIMRKQLAVYMETYVDDEYSKHPPDPKCSPALHGDAWTSGWCQV